LGTTRYRRQKEGDTSNPFYHYSKGEGGNHQKVEGQAIIYKSIIFSDCMEKHLKKRNTSDFSHFKGLLTLRGVLGG